MASSTSLTRTVPNLLRQPFTIAALASVGIHGLVAANFEKISLFPRTAQLPPSVRLMQLSPLQISRLYPPPPQKLSLGTIAAPPSLSTLGPSPTLPEFPATLSTPSFPSFPTSPTLPPISSRLPSIPTSPGISSFPFPNTSSFPPSIPIPNDFPPFPIEPQFQDKNSRELEKLRDRRLAFDNLSQEDREMLENMTPDVYSANIFNPPPVEEDENYGIPPQRYVRNNDETEITTGDETPVDPENFKGSILSNLQKSQQQQQGAVNPETPVTTPGTNNSAQRTAMFAGTNGFVAWAGQLSQDYPSLEAKPPETISSFYPAEACPQQLSGIATVGVAVGTGGEILKGPELLSGTGYSVLDNAAMAKVGEFAVTQLGAQVGSEPTAFWYTFDFNPDNCATPQPATEATPPPPAVQETQPIQPSLPFEDTPAETQSPVDVNPVNEPEELESSPPEMTTPEPELESSPPSTMPIEPELESSPPVMPIEPELESSPPVMPIEPELETSEVTPAPTPSEHKGSLLQQLTTPYTEPEE